MRTQEINKRLEQAKTKIFEAEVILSELVHDESVKDKMKQGLTMILQTHTRDAMWSITDLFIDDVRKRIKK